MWHIVQLLRQRRCAIDKKCNCHLYHQRVEKLYILNILLTSIPVWKCLGLKKWYIVPQQTVCTTRNLLRYLSSQHDAQHFFWLNTIKIYVFWDSHICLKWVHWWALPNNPPANHCWSNYGLDTDEIKLERMVVGQTSKKFWFFNGNLCLLHSILICSISSQHLKLLGTLVRVCIGAAFLRKKQYCCMRLHSY